MARKKGKPPKTPSSSSKESPSAAKRAEGSSSMDFSLSDEEALEDIDSLTPKKAAELLLSIDLLRQRAVENVVAQANGESSKTSFVEESVPESSAAPKEGAKAQDKGKGILVMDASDSKNAETWFPVFTRSKAQMRQGKEGIQKAKDRWIQEGDQNTSYFHNVIRSRQYKNRILSITTAEGVCIQNQQDIMEEFVRHYARLYGRKEVFWSLEDYIPLWGSSEVPENSAGIVFDKVQD
ncbi:hypothetical protein RIF29_25843 [Crotalaria pallida]|uniref:Uncharacterized protein n=1 Tax=Crotalaria pallida TaxID=3830 RepID=A0AAN9HZJ2_CROPI